VPPSNNIVPSFFKNFSLSTTLGLTFGVLLVGYGVFAFDPPTQAPPGENVDAPLHTGIGDQTKTGGLLSVFDFWVDNALGVTGGATFGGSVKIGEFASLPPCDASSEGTIAYNTTIKKLSVCTDTGWEVFSTGADFDNDGFIAGIDCDDSDINIWQNFTGYEDSDGDTYTLTGTSVCSGTSLPSPYLSSPSASVDCDDDNINIWQNFTGYEDSDGDTFTLAGTTVCSGDSLPAPYLSSASASVDCDDSCVNCYPGSLVTTPLPDELDQDCAGGVDNPTNISTSCTISGSQVGFDQTQIQCESWCASRGGGGTRFCNGPVSGFNNACSIDYDSCTAVLCNPTTQFSKCEDAQPIICSCASVYH